MHKSLLCGLMALTLIACGDSGDGSGDETTTTGSSTDDTTTTASATGDGDGDASTGDGDASTGDGDGDGSTGDGDGDGSTGDGDATGDGDGDGDGDGGMVDFSLTSPDFVEGGIIPSLHHIQGGNVSPELVWEGAPSGTMSFGVFFHDETISYDHSAIWDIPSSATGLPQDVDHDPMPADVPGATQCRHWNGGWGYGGPGSSSNDYRFTLYALDVATLPNVTQDTDRSDVKTELDAHAIETVTLGGQTEGPP
jgi:phosphatidylethanolamine-binding protein (PEBP) family uncharacterized protein